MLLLSPPTPSTMPPRLSIFLGIAPSNAVASGDVCCASVIRSAHLPSDVLRIPNAYFTLSDGLFGFAGCWSSKPPHPGSPIFEPPAQTPASKSAMNHGPLPAPLPQKALPKNSVFITPYLVGSVVTFPKSQQQPLPTWVPSANSYTPWDAVPRGMFLP